MAQVQAEIKRGLLRQIAEGAKSSGVTFYAALLAFQAAISDQPSFRRGKLTVATSGNGQSASFQISAPGSQFTPEMLFAASEEFFDILSDTLGAFALTDTGEQSATTAIFEAMKQDNRLYPVNAAGLDVTLIGQPFYGVAR